MNAENQPVNAEDQPEQGLPRPDEAVRRVTVIVPAYRSRAFLPACLTSLEAQTGVEVTVIVSDNASQDGSVEYIREHHPGVRIVENGANLGFSAAVNRAMEKAKEAPFVALVNPDATARPDCMVRLVEALEAEPEAGIAAARMMTASKPERIDCLGVAVTSAFGQLSIGGGRSDFPGFRDRHFVPAACGGGMLIRGEVLQCLGGFDEDYFLCWEDIEFSFRAYRSGYRSLYVPEAVIYHLSTAVMGHWSKVNVLNYCRGALPTAVKLLPLGDLLRLLPSMILNRAKIAFLYAGGGRLGTAVRGEGSAIPLAWRMFRKRGKLPPARKGFRLRDLLVEGDRLRALMKQGEAESPPPEGDREGPG